MHTEYINKFLSLCEPGTLLVSEYITARGKITLKCTHGHFRDTTANEIISKGGGRLCKECNGTTSTGRKLQSTVEKEFTTNSYTLLGEYTGALNKVLARNNKCEHEYMVTPSSVIRGRNILCPICSPSRRINYTSESFEQEILKYDLEPVDSYINMKTNINVRNINCDHTYNINPGHLLYDGVGTYCKVCSALGSIKTRFFTKLLDNNLTTAQKYTTSQNSINITNNICGHEYEVIPNNIVCADTGLVCRVCFPTQQVSKAETQIYEFIKSIYDGWIIQSERQILSNNRELDIVIPDLGIAIEYNGAKWHDVESKGYTYHLDKQKEVEDFGYKLIHIMDTEWVKSPEIVKSRIRSILHIGLNKFNARDMEIKEIPFPREFLTSNHIQGAGSYTKYNYGAFKEGELLAVMTFTKARFNNEYEYELVRFCSKLNTSIRGIASKLLKEFLKTHTKSIVSYADKRWSSGNLYEKLGFVFSHNSKPNYRYYKYKYSLSRYQCQKHLLKDMFPNIWSEAKSEYDIMKEAGYHKVSDCGNSVWVLK